MFFASILSKYSREKSGIFCLAEIGENRCVQTRRGLREAGQACGKLEPTPMMRFALILALANASVVTQHARGEHPAVKIIALLQKLQAQVKAEGEEETHLYGKFTYWCDETIKEKTATVKDYEETMSVASSTMEASIFAF